MFSSKASNRDLSKLTHKLSVSLHAGVGILKAFQLATRDCKGSVRAAMESVQGDLKSGSTISEAFKRHEDVFPSMFIDMLRVGETTGHMPEVFKALSEHFDFQMKLTRDVIRQITWPVFQLLVAIGVIGLLILVLGIIGDSSGMTFDVLGWGLLGISGALTWFTGWILVFISLFLVYRLTLASPPLMMVIHQFLMRIPVVGSTMQALAIARFSWAFALTQGNGLDVEQSLESSLKATSNGQFLARIPSMLVDIRSGEDLYSTFYRSELFTTEYLEFVAVAENSGTVPEAMKRMSDQFADDARRALETLATVIGWCTWLTVAVMIIFLIMKIAMWYVSLLNSVI